VLNSIKNKIEGINSKRVSLNMSAPMNHIENENLKTRYLQIIQAAWESVFGENPLPVEQGMNLNVLSHRFKGWMEKKVRYAFLLGLVYSTIGIISAMFLFGKNSGLAAVAFTSILLIPSLNKLLTMEENIGCKSNRGIFM